MGPSHRGGCSSPPESPAQQTKKSCRVKGRAAFPPQETIQSSSRRWLFNQKMNKKWTRRKNSRELAALMWEGHEVGFQTPDSSKYISNRCEDNEERSSEDRFVDKPNLLIIPDAEQEMLRISTRIWMLLSAAKPWHRCTNDVLECSDGNKNNISL